MGAPASVLVPVLIVAVGWSSALSAGEALPDVVAKPGWDDLPPITADAATDWPWWRGPACDGQAAPGQQPVTSWGEQSNVVWRVALEGTGHGTPCIRGGRIYLAAGDRKAGSIWVAAFEQASGRKLWQTEVYHGAMPKAHKDNSPASSTIACDGERLFFPYQAEKEVHMTSLDLTGKVMWDRSYGPYQSVQGHSASPAFYHSAVLLAVDGKDNKQLTALHRRTGEVVWRTGVVAEGSESYASPLVAHIAGRDQAVVVGPVRTRSYDPMTGKMLWDCDGPAPTCAAVAAFSADHVFVLGGWPIRTLEAIRADGAGDVTASHLAWKDNKDKKAGYIPSPLHHDGLLYEMIDNGLFRCYDAVKGTVVWEHDTKAPFYSSPVLVGNRIFVFDQKGKGYVFTAGRDGKLATTNDLAPGAFATPVFLGGRMYLRTLNALYCFGTP